MPGIMESTSHKLIHFILPTAHDMGIIIAPILQRRKLRPSGLHNLPIVMELGTVEHQPPLMFGTQLCQALSS